MIFEWEYYPKYDINVNTQTGELRLPICDCKPEDKCCYLMAWEADGCPTHLEKEELEQFIKLMDGNNEDK